MFNICLNALLRFVFLTFVFEYLWFCLGFIDRCVYIMYLYISKYLNMWKVWIAHCPFLIDKIFSITFPKFFRQPAIHEVHLYQWKNFQSFHGLILRNFKMTEITKIIFAAIIFREGTQLETSDWYQNIKALLKSFRAIWKSLYLSST